MVGSSSNVMCSLICIISACRKPSTSLSDSERSSRAKFAIAGLTTVRSVERRNRLGGKRSSVPRSTPPVSWVSIRPSTVMVRSAIAPIGQDMRDVAERILVHVEPRIGGDVDLPFGDVLAVMAARRHAQNLNHAGGRRLIAIAGGMGNSQAHDGPESEFRSTHLEQKVRHARTCSGHPRLSSHSSQSKTWMAGSSPAMTMRVPVRIIRSDTAW